MKLIFFTGIAGSGKPQYLEEFKRFCDARNKSCQIISVGDIIFRITEELGLHIREAKLLNSPRSTLKTLLANAFERIPKIINPRNDVVIISSHASYWWKKGPEHAFDISYLHKITPDIYVTMLQDATVIKNRIENDPKWGKDVIAPREILIWSELEIYTTEILAQLQNKPYYLLHFNHPVENLYRLIFEPKLKKVYISHPITFLSRRNLAEVARFIKELNRYAIVFKPFEIAKEISRLKKPELQEIFTLQAVRRDYRLIDQSDRIVIYLPKIVSSSGVENERTYAHNANKEVWIIYPEKRKSPFTSYYTDRFFKTTADAIKAFKKER